MSTPTAHDPQAFEAARAAFLEGLDALQHHRLAEAEARFRASLALLPGRVSTQVNLAATLIRLERPAEALAIADAILAVEPDNRDAWFHRACALGRLDRAAEALPAFERVQALGDDQAEVWLEQSQALHSLGRLDEALAGYDRALALAPSFAAAWTNRGSLLRETGRHAEAKHSFEQATAHGADPALHAYYLAAVGGGTAPAQAPAGYVAALFDGYAEGFEQHLVDVLRYRAPEGLVQQLGALGCGPFDSTLELGCGTGLAGPLLAKRTRRLVGLDLSARMLDAARARGVYDALVQADMAEHLATTDERHDLVFAADTFIYAGDLGPVFRGAQRVLRPGGIFSFTVERAGPGVESYELRSSLRYAHAEAALRGWAEAAGFEWLGLEVAPIREDQGRGIEGFYVCLRRE